MAIFTHKIFSKNSYKRFSRIPYGDISLSAYKIRPYTYSLVEGLNDQLNEIVKNAPESIDGQNGDVLDNYIKNWENRAKANLNAQKALRVGTIIKISSERESNIKNAEDWLDYEKQILNKKQKEVEDCAKKYKSINDEYFNW